MNEIFQVLIIGRKLKNWYKLITPLIISENNNNKNARLYLSNI